MRKVSLYLLCTALLVQGCAVHMAAEKQTKKDLSVLRIGGNRDDIVRVLGAPYMTQRNEDGSCKDIYKIVEGAGSKGTKTLAVAGHTAMDVLTLGLWEIVGTPLELATREQATMFILYYDTDSKLKAYDAIK